MDKDIKATAKDLMNSANIKDEDLDKVVKSAEGLMQDFLDEPDKEWFNRMVSSDMTVKAITDEIRQMGPEKMFEEAKKSKFAERVFQIIGVYVMLGVKMGYVGD